MRDFNYNYRPIKSYHSANRNSGLAHKSRLLIELTKEFAVLCLLILSIIIWCFV